MYVYCIFPAMSKSPKQVQNYLKIAGTSIFNGGLCKICACTVTICKKSVIRIAISWSVIVYNKTLSSQCKLTAQIEPLQDKNLSYHN